MPRGSYLLFRREKLVSHGIYIPAIDKSELLQTIASLDFWCDCS